MIPNQSDNITLERVAQQCEDVENFCETLTTESSTIKNSINNLKNSANRIGTEVKNPPKIKVAVLGESGAGKSTLLNSLLDSQLLPKSGNEVCTAGITRITSCDIDNYRISVSYMNFDDWKTEMSRISNDIKFALEELDVNQGATLNPNIVNRMDRERVIAVYGADAASEFFLSGVEDLLVEPPTIKAAFEATSEVLEFDNLDERITSELKRLLTDGSQNTETVGQVWPIIQDVLVEGRFVGLPEQLELVDLPGVNDPNSAREDKTLKFLQEARFLLVAYNSVRPPTEQVSIVLRGRQLAKKLILSGRNDSITFVATKSDNFDEDDQLFSEYEDLSVEAMAKRFVLEVRRTLKKSLKVIAQDVSNDSESPDEAEKLYQSLIDSHLFVTSSSSYWKIKNAEAGKRVKTPPPFTLLKDTEIPGLRQRLTHLATVAGPLALAKRSKTELIEAIKELESIVANQLASSELSKDENQKQLTKMSESITDFTNLLISGLSPENLNESGRLQQTISEFLDSSKIEVVDAIHFGRRYKQTVGNLHWSTLRAACARGGRYHSGTAGLVDLQSLVVEPIIERILTPWTELFATSLPEIVSSTKMEIEQRIIDYTQKMHDLIGASSDGDVPRILNNLIHAVRDSTDQSLAAASQKISIAYSKAQEELLEVVRTAVTKNMLPEIYAAGNVRGTGSSNRMREMLSEGASSAFANSYNETLIGVKAVLDEVSQVLEDAISSLIEKIKVGVVGIQEAVVPREEINDESMSESIHKISNQIKEFESSLYSVYSSQSDIAKESLLEPKDQDSVPIEINTAGPFVLVDGSNVSTFFENGVKVRSLERLLLCNDALKIKFPNKTIKIFVDANYRHMVKEEERVKAESLLNSEVLIQPGPRSIGKGDALVLAFAQDTESIIISNDAYKEFVEQFPCVLESGKIWNHTYDKDLGWRFIERLGIN